MLSLCGEWQAERAGRSGRPRRAEQRKCWPPVSTRPSRRQHNDCAGRHTSLSRAATAARLTSSRARSKGDTAERATRLKASSPCRPWWTRRWWARPGQRGSSRKIRRSSRSSVPTSNSMTAMTLHAGATRHHRRLTGKPGLNEHWAESGAGRGVRTCMAILHREHQGANTVCEEDSTHRDTRQGCRHWSWRRCAIRIGGNAQHRTPTAIRQLDGNVGGALGRSRLAQGEDLAKQGMGRVNDGDLASHLIG